MTFEETKAKMDAAETWDEMMDAIDTVAEYIKTWYPELLKD